MDFTDFLFPRSCLECGRSGFYICFSCLRKVPFAKLLCAECEKPSIDGATHFKCQRKWGLNGIVSLWSYSGVVRKSILKIKFRFAREITKELSEYIFWRLKSFPSLPKNLIIIPIPQYWWKENFRGFNPTFEIGKQIALKTGWRLDSQILVKRKFTRPQTGLSGEERKKNVRRVFALSSNYKLLPTTYMLFDDVYTTGSTLKEACKVLKRNGARNVWGLTIAR